MPKKDLYKRDNYMIRIGVTLFIIGAFSILFDPRNYYDLSIKESQGGTTQTTQVEDYDGRTFEEIQQEYPNAEIIENGFPIKRTIITFGALGLWLVGINFRRKEKKIIQIWDALEISGEAKVTDLSNSLGLTRNFILESIQEINAQPGVYYAFDKGSDKIMDGRLMTEFVVNNKCHNCGREYGLTINLSLATPPACTHCGTPAESQVFNNYKQEILNTRTKLETQTEESTFNTGVFILLLFFFWPGAIIYYIRHKTNFSKALKQQQGNWFSTN
ncbi:MAG TPA: hypothetical protein DCE41_16375 [Cytophagales bacterium]|nr:hypothetical protein [Cytophagales bacterium]HAA20436.1 hypothetical protein [Cytophagales bacterium]HAP60117.1 hypothetical protein [Cytophagales bacterium]